MLSMNGICAEQLTNSGYRYEKNFGVSIARLREIASEYTPDYTLAYRLWLLPIRETKILATMLCPPSDLNIDNIDKWTAIIDNNELAETAGSFLFSKAPHLTLHFISLLNDPNPTLRITAYCTIAKQTAQIIARHDISTLCLIMDNISGDDLDSISAYRPIETIIYQIEMAKINATSLSLDNLYSRIYASNCRFAPSIIQLKRLV